MSTTTTEVCTDRGFAALAVLVDVKLGETPTIVRHEAGIDIDNGARPYDRELEVSYDRMLWHAMLYVSSSPNNLRDGYTVDDLFSADYVNEPNGHTTTRLLWFHIHTDIFDTESRGVHFEMSYPQIVGE